MGESVMTPKDEFIDHMDDYNIIEWYKMSKWWMCIILTIIMPFALFGWII